jgi:hypothetical protein
VTLALRQAQLFECAVCKQYIDDAARQETAVRDALFGARAYAVCPACGQEAPDFKTRALGAYKRRADRWIANARMRKADEALADMKAAADILRQEWKMSVLERDRHEAAIRRTRAHWQQALTEYHAARRSRREAAP